MSNNPIDYKCKCGKPGFVTVLNPDNPYPCREHYGKFCEERINKALKNISGVPDLRDTK